MGTWGRLHKSVAGRKALNLCCCRCLLLSFLPNLPLRGLGVKCSIRRTLALGEESIFPVISRAADGGLAGAALVEIESMALTFSFTTVDVYGDEQ